MALSCTSRHCFQADLLLNDVKATDELVHSSRAAIFTLDTRQAAFRVSCYNAGELG